MTDIAAPFAGRSLQRAPIAPVLSAILAVTAGVFLYCHLTSPFWLDEVATGALACQKDAASVIDIAATDVHPPTYVLFVHALFSAFGCNLLAARLASLAFTLLGVTLLALSLDANVAGRAKLVLIFAAMPSFWHFAVEGRSYAVMFAVACGVIFLATRRSARGKQAAVYLALFGATNNYFGLYLIPVALALGFAADRRCFEGRIFRLSAALLAAAVVALYSKTLPPALVATSQGFWIRPPGPDMLYEAIPNFIFGYPLAVDLVLLTLAVSALALRKRLWGREGLWLAGYISVFSIFVIVLTLISYLKPVFVERYAFFLTPFVAVFIWRLTGGAPRETDERAPHLVNLFACCVFGLLCLLNTRTVLEIRLTLRSMNWERAAQEADCSKAVPCVFVLDDAVQTAFSDAQYAAVANFFATDKASFVPVRPTALEETLAGREQAKLLYVGACSSRLQFTAIETAQNLQCRDYRKNCYGAKFCVRRS